MCEAHFSSRRRVVAVIKKASSEAASMNKIRTNRPCLAGILLREKIGKGSPLTARLIIKRIEFDVFKFGLFSCSHKSQHKGVKTKKPQSNVTVQLWLFLRCDPAGKG